MHGKKIAIEEADLGQLKAFAQTVLGLEFPKNASAQVVRGKMQEAGYNADFITVFEQVQPGPSSHVDGRSARDASRVEKESGRVYYRILIPNEEKPGGEEQVPVSVNGRRFDIPRGQVVEVPEEYVEVLENAQAYVYEPYSGEGLGGLKAPKVVKSYPFSYA
jgi:hypothetical protein